MHGLVRGLGGAVLPPRRATSRPSSADGAESDDAAGTFAGLPHVHSSSGLATHGPASSHQFAALPGGNAVATPSGEPAQPTLSDHSAAVQQQHQTARQQAQQQGEPPARGRSSAGRKRQHAPSQQPSGGSRQRQNSLSGLKEGRPARSRRQRSATPSAGAAAVAPPAKRRRAAAAAGGAGTPGSGPRPSKYADIMHRCVEVPGAIFYIDTPGVVFIGRVNKAESGRKVPSVEVQFLDDHQKYWFPVADVRRWMGEMVRSGSWEERNPGIPAPDFAAIAAAAEGGAGAAMAAAGARGAPPGGDEEAAAKTLQSLSVSATSRPAASGATGSAQPAVSTGRQRGRAGDVRTASTAAGGAVGLGQCLQRSGSEVKRVGALDIMATAADCANSPPAC